MLKRVIFFCLLSLFSYFSIVAEASDSRWKMYYSTARDVGYYDTQTVTTNPGKQFVKVWAKVLNKNTGRTGAVQAIIDYPEQTIMVVGYVKNQNGRPTYQRLARPIITPVIPDSLDERFTRVVAQQVGRSPMYAGGPNRWKTIRVAASYRLLIATDCGLYNSLTKQYAVWIKQTSRKPGPTIKHYFCDLNNGTVGTTALNGKPPVPESDEEAILNGARKLYQSGNGYNII
ncbi:hypothetical protein [Acidaminococcus timonensis]|uniref:hypothetical protein n=1 Tax=Acidaminococcus timonensis TaxID=1871002 RepID=UPI0026F1ADFE|nr:hypothetical protein [Acidaminococcus timonensis]